MKAVVMECRIRVCGSPSRIQRFIDHASTRAVNKFASPVKRSIIVEDSDSVLLRRQWHRENDVDDFGVPIDRELCLAFADPSARITASKLESLSRDVLSELELDPWTSEESESVPWILTLTTDVDHASRQAIAERHPLLELSASPVLAAF